MKRVFITGSSAGLGLMAAQLLVEGGHRVVLHARDGSRASDALRALPEAEAVAIGNLETISGAKAVAAQVNALGRFDAVIHNAAVGPGERYRLTADGLPHVFAINTLSTYLLTALIERPDRLVYLSSDIHRQVNGGLDDILWRRRRWNGLGAYAESKLHDAMLASELARRWPRQRCNALEPGWVPTRMGGPNAPDDIDKAHRTQVWLATSDDPDAQVTGAYFHHGRRIEPHPQTNDPDLSARLIALCEEISKVSLPM